MATESGTATPRDKFDTWAQEVGLLTETRELSDTRYQATPEVRELKGLLADAKRIPQWVTQKDSVHYQVFVSGGYADYVASLVVSSTTRDFSISSNDATLDREVAQSLQCILSIPLSAYLLLNRTSPIPNEADRRSPMNALMASLWDYQTSGAFFNSNECRLRLPKAPARKRDGIQPDSSAFFRLQPETLRIFELDYLAGCSAIWHPRLTLENNVLHWVVEYKRDLNRAASRRQVLEGLTTALYQRRALGFTRHFVFGAAHHSQTSLDIIAATWIPEEHHTESVEAPTKVDNEILSTSGAEKESGSAEDRSGALLKGKTYTEQPEGTGDQYKPQEHKVDVVKDSKQRNKIVVYELGTLDVRSTSSMLNFYLLMRRTRDLAVGYMEEITQHSRERILLLTSTDKDLYNWFDPPPSRSQGGSRSGSRTGSGSNKRPRMDTVAEQECMLDPDDEYGPHDGGYFDPDDSMSSDPYDREYDDQSDATSESTELPSVSDVEEMTVESREKIRTFIASSMSAQSQADPSATQCNTRPIEADAHV